MANALGTFPANLTGISESANAPALTSNMGVNAMNPRLVACEWTANKGNASGYAGLDTNAFVPDININHQAIANWLVVNLVNILPTTLPASPGQLWNNGGNLSIS